MAGTTDRYLLADEPILINGGRRTVALSVRNTGDRPIQVGSHFLFSKPTVHFNSTARKR